MRLAGGFAATGSVEALVRTQDLTRGFGLAWNPPADLCARVLARPFPNARAGTEPWLAPLWATGRAGLDGLPRLSTWRWDGTPPGAGRAAPETRMRVPHGRP